jgi:hypothetical protein
MGYRAANGAAWIKVLSHFNCFDLKKSIDVTEFQATDADSSLGRTRALLYRTNRLSIVETKDVMYRMKHNIFKSSGDM